MLLLLLPLLVSGAPSPGPCCSSKTVGGLDYTFVREDSSALSLSCLSPCVYERAGGAGGPHYCFARGEKEVFCGNATSSGPETGQEVMKAIPGARKSGIYWNESLTELFDGANSTDCQSKLFCSSAEDPLKAFVLIEPEKYDGTEMAPSAEELCDIADRLILEEYKQNVTGIPPGLQLVNSSGLPPICLSAVTLSVGAGLGCGHFPDAALSFCPRAEGLFRKFPISDLRFKVFTRFGFVPLVCCCLTPRFKNNKKICNKCKTIFHNLKCSSTLTSINPTTGPREKTTSGVQYTSNISG